MSSSTSRQELLKKYAEAIVRVGLNLRKGQRLIIHNATARGVPFAARPLVHEVTKAAYAAGAKYVEVIWGDEETHRIRLKNAPADSFDEYPKFYVNAVLDMIRNGDAILSIYANDPDAYLGLDAERIAAMQKAHLQNYVSISTEVSRNAVNWCVVASAAPAWAAKVFPGLSPEEAEAKLWEAIFETTRINQPDPIAAWQEHIQTLNRRSAYLQAKNTQDCTTRDPARTSPSACPRDTNGSAPSPSPRTAWSSPPTCPPRRRSPCPTAIARKARSPRPFRSVKAAR